MATPTTTSSHPETLLRKMTPEEYLTFERQSPEKHELHHGYLLPMSGASEPHNRITSNLHIFLGYKLLSKDYLIYQSDMRVQNPLTEGYYYPDLVVVHGEPNLLSEEFDTLTNPVLIAEVLSPSTQKLDKGDKFVAYQAIPSLTEFLLIASDRIHVSHYQKMEENRWEIRMYTQLTDEVDLLSQEVRIPLSEIYRRLSFS